MSWLFGKKKEAPKPTAESVSQQNAQKVEELNLKIAHLDKQAEDMGAKAVKFMKSKNKKKAIECMKMKKAFENQSTTLSNMAFNLQQQTTQLQMAALTAGAFQSYADTTAAIKNQLGDLDADKIDDIKSQNEDIQEQLNEMTELLGASDQTVDEEAAMEELDALMELDTEGGEAAEEPASKTKVVGKESKEKEDEDEISNLMAGFN